MQPQGTYLYLEDFLSLSGCEGYALMRAINESYEAAVIEAFLDGYRQCNLNRIRQNMPVEEMLTETAFRLEKFGIRLTAEESAIHLAKLFKACVQDDLEYEDKAWCVTCGHEMELVRPGKHQCNYCLDKGENNG